MTRLRVNIRMRVQQPPPKQTNCRTERLEMSSQKAEDARQGNRSPASPKANDLFPASAAC